jgi:prepilin-type processing-associated H-X9-DG protein
MTMGPTEAPKVPKDVLALFDADIRYCPALAPYCGEGGSSLLPRRIYDGEDWFMFGYYSAIGDNTFVNYSYDNGNRSNPYLANNNDATTWDFYRPFAQGHWSTKESSYENIYYQTYDTQPLFTDMITDSVISHNNGGNPKTTNPGTSWGQGWYDYHPGDLGYKKPEGANSVWADGHVEWHGWNEGSDYVTDNRNRLRGAAAPEGWTYTLGATWVWMKSGKP